MTDPLMDQIAHSNPAPGKVKPPLAADQMLLHVKRQSGTDSRSASHRGFVAAVAAGVALLVFGGWFAATNDDSDGTANAPANAIDAHRVQASVGEVTLAAFGGLSFATTEPAEIVQDPENIAITSAHGVVRIFRPASTASGREIDTTANVIDAFDSGGYEIEMLPDGTMSGVLTTRFKAVKAEIDADHILTIRVPGGELSWSPTPDSVFAIADTSLGPLVAVLEPPTPSDNRVARWAEELLGSVELAAE